MSNCKILYESNDVVIPLGMQLEPILPGNRRLAWLQPIGDGIE